MPTSPPSTLPNSSPVARRSVGFCEGVRTRCSPSAAAPARGGPRTSASAHSARGGRAVIGGECTIQVRPMNALRPAFLWALIVVAAAAGGVYLTDQLFIAPGRALQRQLAERDAQIKVLTEQNQALEAAIRLLRYTERRARLVVLDQAVVPVGHPRTRVRFPELDGQGDPTGGPRGLLRGVVPGGDPALALNSARVDDQGDPIGEPRELVLEGDEVYVDALVIKFEDTSVMGGDALKGKALLLFC